MPEETSPPIHSFEIHRVSIDEDLSNEPPCDAAYLNPARSDEDDAKWLIDLSWNDLPRFIKEHGAIIGRQPRWAGSRYSITIYDSYVE